jgi:hypothetical protein
MSTDTTEMVHQPPSEGAPNTSVISIHPKGINVKGEVDRTSAVLYLGVASASESDIARAKSLLETKRLAIRALINDEIKGHMLTAAQQAGVKGKDGRIVQQYSEVKSALSASSDLEDETTSDQLFAVKFGWWNTIENKANEAKNRGGNSESQQLQPGEMIERKVMAAAGVSYSGVLTNPKAVPVVQQWVHDVRGALNGGINRKRKDTGNGAVVKQVNMRANNGSVASMTEEEKRANRRSKKKKVETLDVEFIKTVPANGANSFKPESRLRNSRVKLTKLQSRMSELQMEIATVEADIAKDEEEIRLQGMSLCSVLCFCFLV